MKKRGSLDVAGLGSTGSRLKPAAARIGRPTERREPPSVDTSVDAARMSASHECVRHGNEIFAAVEETELV